jgi:hypothetical protein
MTNEEINDAITTAINADPHWKCVKDYCSDLNAIHDAEQIFFLWKKANTHKDAARQRAEAFLRTIGKWKD